MPAVKISALPSAAPTSAAILPFVEGGATSRTTVAIALAAGLASANTTTGVGPSQLITNAATTFTASTAIVQRLVRASVTLSQTSTAGASLLQLDATNTALGSGAQYFLDLQVAGTTVAGITNGATAATRGRILLSDGDVTTPAVSSLSEVGTGFTRITTAIWSFIYSGAERTRFSGNNLYAMTSGADWGQNVTNGTFTFSGRVSTAATASIQVQQLSSLAFSATSGSQRGLGVNYTVNQASGTAGFAALRIATTETALGSGQQSMIECYAGAAGTTAVFRVTNLGETIQLGSLSIQAGSPASMGVTENDYGPAGFANKSFVRLTPNAINTVVTGFAGGIDGRMLVLANLGAGTITINHQDAGSAAGNRVITTGAVAIVLVADDCVTMIYDATTARWRQVTVQA